MLACRAQNVSSVKVPQLFRSLSRIYHHSYQASEFYEINKAVSFVFQLGLSETCYAGKDY